MKNVWVGTGWHVWSLNHTTHHPYQSVSNIRQLSDSYAKDIQVDDIFIYLGDLCDPAVTDLNELKMLVNNIPGIKILCRGNHDVEKDYFYKDIGFDIVCDICVIGQVVFSHKPIKVEPDQINIHGHLHTEKWSEYDDANHINAYTPDFYKHPLSITEILQNAYTKFLKTPKIPIKSTDTTSIKGYTDPVILDLTSEFEEYMLSEAALLDEAPAEASISYLMSLSTVDTDEKLLKWVKQNLHVGPMGKVKTDMQMATSHVASDFDIALFVHPRLKKLGHNPRMMILIGYESKNPKPGFVHLFNYWTDIDDIATWFEASWRGHEGIHEFDSIGEMKEEILAAYNGTPEATKYTETILRAVNPAYVKPGNDPQDILKNIFGETGLTESLNSSSEKESIIVVNGVPEPYDAISSSVDWFYNILQIPTQVINIKLLNNVRKVWAECIPGSSPFGGRGKDSISVLLDEKYIPEGFDKPSIKKFVCFFDILVTGDNNLPGNIAAAIAYWYSQPYYDQCFNELPEHLQPNKDVQKAFNTIQVYQRLMNDTAVDILVRELYWNQSEDPKILISSVVMNAVANTYGNQKTPYDNLLSISETTYDLSKYNTLYIPNTNKKLSSFNGKKLTSFIDDLLDANIKITPETIDKEALRQVKNAEDLVSYYNDRYREYTNPNKNEYFGSAYILDLLLCNLHNNKINVWENFVPTGLSESEFASYMDKRFAELDEIELMYQRILSNNIGATKLSIAEAKQLMNDGSLCKVNTKKDGTVVYDYGKDLGKVYINAEIYRDSYKFVKPSRFFTRVNEYDYVIVTHGQEYNNSDIPLLWNIDHTTFKNDAQYTVGELLEEIGTKPKVLLLICNPYGKKISGKFKNVTYAVSGDVLMEYNTSLVKGINTHNRILDRVNIIKAKIKYLKSLSKTINKLGKFNRYDDIHHEYGFIISDVKINDEYRIPRFKLARLNNEFSFSYVNDTIYAYINMLECAKVVFAATDKIYFDTISETGYYWTYSPEGAYIIRECNDNPLVTGIVFDTIDECIADAKEYSGFEEYDPITNETITEQTIKIFKAIKGHPLPGYYIHLDESTCIKYGDYIEKIMINTSDTKDDNLNEILMEPEDAHLFLADDEAGEKSQKPYKERLSTDDEGVIAEAVYDIDKYRKLYNFDEGKYKTSFRGDTKLTSLVEDLLDANIKVSPESIDRVALSNVKSAEGLVKYFSERIDDLTESDSFIASWFIFATLLNNTSGSMNLEKFSDFVPTNLSEDEFSKYIEKRFNELRLIDSIYQEVLKNNIANYALSVSLSSDDILKTKAIIDSDKTIVNTDYALDTVKYSYGDSFATVFINKNIYNQYGSLTLKPSRLYGRASMYDYIIITHGRSDSSYDKWKIEPITINRRTFVDAKSIVSYLGKNASVLFLTCNPDGKLIEGYPKLTYSTTNTLFEKASLTKSYDMINKIIDQLNKRKRQLKTVYTIFDKWYHKHRPVSYPKYVYPQIEFTRYSELALKKVKFTNDDEFYSVGNSILRFINDYRDMLTKSIYILRLFVKVYYNLIPENGYYWIAEKSNKKILTPGVSTINPIIIGNVSTLEECYQEILEFYENDDSLIEHWGDITIYKNHKNSDTVYTNECAHITFDSIINEDAYQLQGIDRDQQDAISKKYGIRAVGHETDEEREFRDKQEREAKERKRLAEKKKKDKQLAKARATKKKYAKKRELEAKREAFKDKFRKKNNEDVDISDIPYNDGSVNFFDNTPGVANFDFANETGYQFEMLDKVKFIDPINESADDRILYPVYVLCVHTGTLLANAIKKATGSHFSHCTISFDSSLKNMYSFGRKVKMTELSNGSFVKESIHNPPYTNEGVNYALYCIPVTASQITAMKKRLEYFVKNKTKFRYDFAGLFKNFFGIADNPEQRWFCSRFVADIINAGTEPGQKPLIREPSLMRPEDFLYTNFALYVTSGLIKEYDQLLVDKVTKKLLRIESIRRAQQRAVQATNIPVTESAVLDLNPYDPNGDMIFNYQLTTMDESAFNELKKYMKSFKIKLDKDGNIIIHRREVDQLDKYFREANQLLKMSKKANNQQGVIDQLCRVYYMINIIDRYYLNSTMTKNNTVKMDLKKELVDLRSVMLNVFQQYLKWITEQNPQFNFQKVYDNSIYSDTKVTIPKQLITDIGKAIVTLL